MKSINHDELQHWFDQKKRDLPWRNHTTPYAVWVSEIMLQQTQVSTVIPYFERWMSRFPTVHDLAAASIEEVTKLWEGLGYYSRARNLHAGAQMIVSEFQGQIPSDPKQLGSIKGIGPYTLGAIRAFAFKQRAAAVDGNVLRVLSRFLAFSDDIQKPKAQKALRDWLEANLPHQSPWKSSEALIELGATVCKPKPDCRKCPLQTDCQALKGNLVHQLPYKAKKIQYEALHRIVAIIVHQGAVLIQQRAPDAIMAGLWEFPFWELDPQSPSTDRQQHALKKQLGGTWQDCPPVKHSFTRYRVTLFPHLVTGTTPEMPGYDWIKVSDLKNLPFSSGHRKILAQLKREHACHFSS